MPKAPSELVTLGRISVARLEGCDDRDQAARLMGAEIAVRREQLPPLPPGEYYWTDLEGLRVVTREGVELGTVTCWWCGASASGSSRTCRSGWSSRWTWRAA